MFKPSGGLPLSSELNLASISLWLEESGAMSLKDSVDQLNKYLNENGTAMAIYQHEKIHWNCLFQSLREVNSHFNRWMSI